jgi:GT2 family glycosyltransferase
VVVVDNASEDDSFSEALRQFPDLFFVKNHKNRGFSGGMNAGIREALTRGAHWVWLFNNDARADTKALSALVAVTSENPSAGLLSPCIYSETNGKLWFGGGTIDFFRMRVIHRSPKASDLKKLYYESEFLTGCALFISKEAIEQVGFLDERFFLYYEDADFSVRARKQGIMPLVVPGARVFHDEQSRKNEKKLYFLVFSGLLFFKKHASGWQKSYYTVYGTMRRIKNALDLMLRRDDALAVYRAYQDFYHGH